MQHHLHSVRQTARHPEDVRGADAGSEADAGRKLPLVHGRPAAAVPLRGAQGQVCGSVRTVQRFSDMKTTLLTGHVVFLSLQDQEPGSRGQSHRRFNGSQRAARREGTDVHHAEGAYCDAFTQIHAVLNVTFLHTP